MAFSKGPRHCLGMNLAYAEIYILLSGIFRRFGSRDVQFDDDEGILELYQTDFYRCECCWATFLAFGKGGFGGCEIQGFAEKGVTAGM